MKQEVLVTLPGSAKASEAQAGHLTGANHFVVVHTLDISHTVALNKMVQVFQAPPLPCIQPICKYHLAEDGATKS